MTPDPIALTAEIDRRGDIIRKLCVQFLGPEATVYADHLLNPTRRRMRMERPRRRRQKEALR